MPQPVIIKKRRFPARYLNAYRIYRRGCRFGWLRAAYYAWALATL